MSVFGKCIYFFIFLSLSLTGLITTTSRKLDREQQDEHILEVRLRFNIFLICGKNCGHFNASLYLRDKLKSLTLQQQLRGRVSLTFDFTFSEPHP